MIRLHSRDPFRDIFNNLFESSFLNENCGITPYKTTNITESDNDYRVQIAVPGLSKEDIKVKVEDNLLTISYDKNNKDFSFISSFSRSYSLPDDGDDTNIGAKVENGVIKITIPRIKKKTTERIITPD